MFDTNYYIKKLHSYRKELINAMRELHKWTLLGAHLDGVANIVYHSINEETIELEDKYFEICRRIDDMYCLDWCYCDDLVRDLKREILLIYDVM